MGYDDCYVCGKDLGGHYQYNWGRKCHVDCHPDNVAKAEERERFKEIGRKEAQAEIARLQDEVARLTAGLEFWMSDHDKRWVAQMARADTAHNDAIEAAAAVADAHDAKKFNGTYSVEHKRKRYDTHQVDRAVNHALNIQSEDATAAIRALKRPVP